MSLAREMTDWIAEQPDGASREEIKARFAGRGPVQIRNAINTAVRAKWIRQSGERRRVLVVYVRTDVPTDQQYKKEPAVAWCDGYGLGDLTRAEMAWQNAMVGQRFSDSQASRQFRPTGRQRAIEAPMSLTGSSADI
jgi:hypothetical protein